MEKLVPNPVLRALEALAAGDALGSTSEFQQLDQVASTYKKWKSEGWPFAQVGGGAFHWKAGNATDDATMARAIVDSWLEQGEQFCSEDIGRRFIEWMNSNPPDIGLTTRQALSAVQEGTPAWRGGYEIWKSNSHAWSNGSLMRNGVVESMGGSMSDAFDRTLEHGLITHWTVLPAICCAAQTYLLRNPSQLSSWMDEFRISWEAWLEESTSEHVLEWKSETAHAHAESWEVFEVADFNPDTFQPFHNLCSPGSDGFVLTTFQVGVWAMHWASRNIPLPESSRPPWPDLEAFEKTGGHALGWVALVGRDSDTYAATAGAMVRAVADLPSGMCENLEAVSGLSPT
ncbi:MAG: ADP-ribosylglycohydrolase family protein [Planctomycetota bacterium]|jgi:ADP-ribosylglycohydrolase|nr:ADP-ribosylglycohydrolase family protein [Planctomycetota bacterium]MDP6942356.1 ADP-ribosylglycohydrolase family protein [Planctomycetota bacterium]